MRSGTEVTGWNLWGVYVRKGVLFLNTFDCEYDCITACVQGRGFLVKVNSRKSTDRETTGMEVQQAGSGCNKHL